MIGPEPVRDLGPWTATVEPLGALLQVGFDFCLEAVTVTPQLRGRVAQGVLVMEEEVEFVLADGEVIAGRVEPAGQVLLEANERGGRDNATALLGRVETVGD